MNLTKVLDGIKIENKNVESLENVDLLDIAYDSRKAAEGFAFVAINGEILDGHDYVWDAYDRGCRIFIIEKDLKLADDAIKIFVSDSRAALSRMSANYFGHPSKELKIIGVTGTKGKTTTANYMRGVLLESGIKTGIIGTIGVYYGDYESSSIHTTPESYPLQKTMHEMINAGMEALVMEVSSGGVKMKRVNDVHFDIGIFTNLSPDHIGPREHPDFEDYRYCKSKLFTMCKHGIINLDDEHADFMIENATCDIATFSINSDSDFRAKNILMKRDDMELGVHYDYYKNGELIDNVFVSAPGEFNVYNSLAVVAACDYLGIDKSIMLEALSKTKVDGRVEILPILPGVTVVLDFAHNGISLENILKTLKLYNPNRLISLFGSVGGRTFVRRKELGDAAAKYSDIAIVTSDNPDYEDPMKIIEDIAQSFGETDCQLIKIVDRVEAIYKSLEIAEEGDIVVIAGKGHEKFKIVNGQRLFFDEKAEVIAAAKRLRESRGEK